MPRRSPAGRTPSARRVAVPGRRGPIPGRTARPARDGTDRSRATTRRASRVRRPRPPTSPGSRAGPPGRQPEGRDRRPRAQPAGARPTATECRQRRSIRSAIGPDGAPTRHQDRSATSRNWSEVRLASPTPRIQPGSRSLTNCESPPGASSASSSAGSSGSEPTSDRAVSGRKGRPSSRLRRRRRSSAGFRRVWTRNALGLLPARVQGDGPAQDYRAGAPHHAAGHAGLHIQQSADPADQFIDIQRLVQKIVGTRGLQVVDLVFLDHPRDADDLDVGHRRIAADQLADRLSVDVRQHHIQDDQVGVVLLRLHPRTEAVVDDAGLEPGVAGEDLRDQVHDRLIVVNDQHPTLAALESVGRDAVLLHEPIERIPRDAAKPRAGDPKALELARVEAADDRLLAHLTYLRRLARRENGLHGRARPTLRDQGQVPSMVARTKIGGRQRLIGLPASPAHDAQSAATRMTRPIASIAPISQ